MMLRRMFSIMLLLCVASLTACDKKDGGKSGSSPSGDKKGGGKSDDKGSNDKSGGKGGGKSGGKGGSSGGTEAADAGKSTDEKGGPQAADQVKIPEADQGKAGIRVGMVETRSMPQVLRVNGQVAMDEAHTSHLGALADGRIMTVNVLPGAYVSAGQTLATLHSHIIHETAGALAQAYAAVDRQRSALDFSQTARERYNHLYSIQAASLEEAQRADQEVQQAKNMLRDADANVRMEREHLSELLQVSPSSITPATLYARETVPIRAVSSGTVIARNVTVGQVVDTGFEAFTISNLASVWVLAVVNERDLSLVHQGAPVQVSTQGDAEQTFSGRVTNIGSTLDPETRTIPVRINVPNPRTRLRPGMFAAAQIAGPLTRTAVFVPEDALQDINGVQVVFVTVDGSTFHAEAVTVGTRSGGHAEITNGLKPGDHIVVAGAFMVKAEMLKGTMGDG